MQTYIGEDERIKLSIEVTSGLIIEIIVFLKIKPFLSYLF